MWIWTQVKAWVLLICRASALKAGKEAVILGKDSKVFGNQWEMVAFFKKTSSLINKTLVIQKTVGVTDGWCFFSCRPVSSKIMHACVLTRRKKMWAWRYQQRGRGTQTNQVLPSLVIERLLSLLLKKRCAGVCKGSLTWIQINMASFSGWWALGLPAFPRLGAHWREAALVSGACATRVATAHLTATKRWWNIFT